MSLAHRSRFILRSHESNQNVDDGEIPTHFFIRLEIYLYFTSIIKYQYHYKVKVERYLGSYSAHS